MFDEEKLKEIETKMKDYEEKVKKAVERFPERKSEFKSTSGYEFRRLYTPVDIEGFNYLEDLGFPGSYPFTRGVQPTMYRARFWTMRQYAGFGTAEESNKRYKYLLEQGQMGLSVAFDLPTQIGYDSDDPMAEGEVGKVGVAIDSLEDMEVLFDGIPLDKVSTSMTINSTASILLAMYIAVAEKQGVPMEKLSGTIQNDILKEYIARGTYIFPPQPSMRIITDIFEFCSKNMPKWNPISISGYHIREAGSTAVQEVAFTLADAIAYVETAIKAGLDPNVFGRRLSFFFAAHNNFLEEIAKFRAARRLWAKIMKERFGVTNEKAMMLRFHTQTGGSTLTAQQPLNNIIRVTLQALAAVLGGTQSLHTNSYDEALGLPTEESVRIALRTQQIIAYESGVADTIDPLGGSYVIESLTNKIEEEAMKYIEKIDAMGGMVKAIETGYVQKEIHESAYKMQLSIENEEEIIVGVNKFQIEEDLSQKEVLKVKPELEEKQKAKLKKLKEKRDNEKVKKVLLNVKKAASSDENLMPYIIEAVKSYATVGEISNALREVFGEYTETIII
ncbi:MULTISPECIES: methylmalonyl-CoA mutase family protein [unclassified Thermosipho (in: thermotogales)]|uniref:acyl-CoA mutase large subunit family protein n=1 Tax=unclassified Thermosipho (in: thermotogales) TaxID=2676525 RepID=UPI000986BAC5|nr:MULTISPECIES: methylmalonyl-CoA mutase family protein [unclassified Thermosipho (in: thermotogales)]MBT1248414.1 methylmalonyl-CoA mutase [Thermosipho sp. 1244]OOC47542.1 methylmalonyl-CoA mutase [Thermosipho sp. 1223]